MAAFKYSYQKETGKHAKAVGRDLPISLKHSVNVCKFIRDKNVDTAISELELVTKLKKPVPYFRYVRDLGHKKGDMTSGRFPIKTCLEIINVLKGAKKNAQNLGLSLTNLHIVHIRPHKSSITKHYGRSGGTRMKRASVEVILMEKTIEKKTKRSSSDKKNVIKK